MLASEFFCCPGLWNKGLSLFSKNIIFKQFQVHSKIKRRVWKFPGFPGGLVVESPPANAGDIRDEGLIPGQGRSPGGGNGNPSQYSCLENPMDRGPDGYSPQSHRELDAMTEHTQQGTEQVIKKLFPLGDYMQKKYETPL